MILFHGSNLEIGTIDLSLSKSYKDFGRGFYLTSICEQAEKMARRTSKFFGGEPVVTSFEAPDDLLNRPNLNIKVFEGLTEEWALFIINNRNRNFNDVASNACNLDCKYDVVYGPVGNDDITVLLRQYTRGYVDAAGLRDGLAFKKASDQYSFHTEGAVSLLRKAGAWRVS